MTESNEDRIHILRPHKPEETDSKGLIADIGHSDKVIVLDGEVEE